MNNFPTIADHILIWAFGIIIPFLSGLQSDKLSGSIILDSRSRIRLYLANSMMLGLAGSSILILWLVLQRPFGTLGLKSIDWKHQEVVIPVVILFMLLYLVDTFFTYKAVEGVEEVEAVEAAKGAEAVSNESSTLDWIKRYSFLPQQRSELPSYLLLCLCAGIFEEIIYRGFMVTYFLPTVTNNIPWMAIIAPSVFFSLAHYYQGWTAVLKIVVFSMLFSIIFIYTKSLYPTIIIHFIIDVLSGIIYMVQQQKVRQQSKKHT